MVRKRYWWRTFFILLTLLCIALGVIGARIYRNHLESVAIDKIRSAGGIMLPFEARAYRVQLHGKSFDDATFLQLVPFLRQLPKLIELDLVDCPITDVGLESVSQLGHLRELYIFQVAVTEEGVANLQQRIPQLKIKKEMPDPVASCLVSMNIYRHAITTLALGEGGATFVTGSGDGTLRWWSFFGEEVQRNATAHTDWLFSSAFSPDRSLLATGGGDSMIALWDTRTRKQIGKLRAHTDDVHAVAFSRDGKTVFSAGDDMSVRRATLEQFTEKPTAIDGGSVMGYHDDTIPCIAVALDGGLVASGSRDDSIQLWNANDGTPVRRLTGHTDDVITVAFIPTTAAKHDGPVLVSGSYDGSIRLWSTNSGGTIGVLKGHAGRVYSVDVSSEGTTIASAGEDGVIVWDGETCQAEYHLRDIENASCVRFRDSHEILVTDAMGTVRVIDIATGKIVRRANTSRAILAKF